MTVPSLSSDASGGSAVSSGYVIGVDAGTGGCKVTVLGSEGTIHASVYVPYPSIYANPGWVEQDPEQWREAALSGVAQALSGFSAAQRAAVRGLIFSAPHHIAVLLDADGRPVRNAIMWNDQRSGEQVRRLQEQHGDLILDVTRNNVSATWTLAHLAWLTDHEPEVRSKAVRMVYMKDYLRSAFSGGDTLTDYIEGGGTLYWDLRRREWSRELLEIVGFADVAQPEIVTPTTVVGTVTPAAAERTGLPLDALVYVGTADSAAEIYAAGGVRPGDAVVKLATAGNLQVVTDALPSTTRPLTYEHPIDGQYYVNTATNFAAASFRWFRESFVDELAAERGVESYEITEADVSGVPAGSRGLMFHPYLNGERSPLWDPKQRGSFFGVTPVHDRAHFTRAVMEGVAMSIRHASKDHDRFPEKARLVGGGANSVTWGQIVSDVLGIPVEVPELADSSAGTALLAATELGWFSDVAEAAESAQNILRAHEPNPEAVAVYEERFALYTEYEEATRSIAHRLADSGA